MKITIERVRRIVRYYADNVLLRGSRMVAQSCGWWFMVLIPYRDGSRP